MLIAILLLGVMPFSIKGFVIDSSFWTIGMISSCLFVVICAYLGWEKKQANRISVSVLLFLSLIVFSNGSYFVNNKDYIFNNNFAASADIVKDVQVQGLTQDDVKNMTALTYDFGLGGERDDYARLIAIDKENNIYVTGHFSGTINLDQGNLKRTSLGGVGDTSDIYVVKYNAKKEFVWGFTIGSVGNDSPNVLKVVNGGLYLAGSIGGKVDFDSGEKEVSFDSGVGQDGFIANYDLDGNYVWAKPIGNPEIIPFIEDDTRFEDVTSVAIDKDENVFVSGYFDGTLDFVDASSNINSLTNANQKKARDIFVVKYDKDGNYLKGFALFGDGRKESNGLLVDADNNIYLAGTFNSKISFDNANPKKITYTKGGKDIFLVKYDQDFNLIWVKKWGSASNDTLSLSNLIFDNDNNILLSGNLGGYMNIDGFKKGTNGVQDVFWAKIDKDGVVAYVNSLGGAGNDGVNAIMVDSLNNVYIGGYFSGSVNFDSKAGAGDAILYSISSGESSDAFLVKYDKDGNYLWANSFGGDVSLAEESQAVSSLVIDNFDYPIVAGNYYKDLIFHSSPELDLSSKGLSDGIIIKYDPEGGIK